MIIKSYQKSRHPLLLFCVILILVVTSSCKNKKEEKQTKVKNTPATVLENNADIGAIFLDASMNGDLNKVKQIVRGGLDVNTSGDQRRTALMLASYNGHTDIVTYLLKKGAQVNALDDMGRSALIYAAGSWRQPICQGERRRRCRIFRPEKRTYRCGGIFT